MPTHNTPTLEPRYQAIRGAFYTARPLSDLDKYIISCCDGTVTLADLAKVRRLSIQEITRKVFFLRLHALVRPVAPPAARRGFP